MLADVDDHIEVASRASAHASLAAASAAQAGFGVDAGGDFDFHSAGFFNAPLALAACAGFFDDPATAVACGASLRDLEKTSRGDNLPAPAASRAGDDLRALLRTSAPAGFARVELADFDFFFATARGLLERDLQIVAQVRAPLAARGVGATATAAEKLLKNPATATAENLAKNIERVVEAAAGAHSALERRVAVAVVGGAFRGIAQRLVGLADFLEFLLRRMVAGIFVGMEFDREFAVGALEVLLADRTVNAEDFVVVPFSAHWAGPLETTTDAARTRRSLIL